METSMEQHRFNIIIVGGGVAGCVLASRISQQRPDLQILLIEAGVSHDDRVGPAMGFMAGGAGSDIEWNYRSTPQASFKGDTVNLTSGKILGGGSAVNYESFTRGPAVDYNQWADMVGDERWSWNGLLPYFKKCETWKPSEDMIQQGIPTADLHGVDGPISVTHTTSCGTPRQYPLKEKLQEFHEIMGHRRILDMNSGYPIGYSEAAATAVDAHRSFATSYKLGSNVTVWCRSTVERLMMKGKSAEGVFVARTTDNGTQSACAMADMEVIVSAGAQLSPKILMLSGIGPTKELEKHNITQVANLPVGENYAEHAQIFTYWTVKPENATMDDVDVQGPKCNWLAGMPVDWMAFCPIDEKTCVKAKESMSPSDYEQYTANGKIQTETFGVYAAIGTSYRKTIPGWPGKRAISVMHILLNPISRGTVKLSSSNPGNSPLLDPNLLSCEIDKSAFYESVRSTAAAIQKVNGLGAVEFGADSVRDDWSDEAITARLRKGGGTVFHPSGTCAMGSVVDTECRVKGIESLRVVDASVFPIPLAAHYQGPVYAVAEQAADMILKSL